MKHKQIHVVYIITKLELGGAQKVCLTLFNDMPAYGITTHLISGVEGTLVNTVKDKQHTILLESFKREISFSALWHELSSFIALIKQLRALKKKYKHIIVHTHSTKAGLLGRWAAFCAGIKTRIHTVHGYGFHDYQSWLTWSIIYLLELITGFITTHFVCVSSADVKVGLKLFPRFMYKHSIIRAAIDWQQFYIPARIAQPELPTTQPFIFGTIACFKPQKNLFDLLQAFKLVHAQNKNTRLEIIGDGAQRSKIERWLTQHNLSKVVTLHGWQEHVAPIMFAWHAFVLSSLWEGLPCAIVEARMLRLPIISYDTGGIHDVVLHGDNGLLCSQKDWHSLACHMLAVSTDHFLYQQFRTHHDDLHDFNNTSMVREHNVLYKKLVHQKAHYFTKF
jgi:glycosyltransferase involved in cell wall biosynthesis